MQLTAVCLAESQLISCALAARNSMSHDGRERGCSRPGRVPRESNPCPPECELECNTETCVSVYESRPEMAIVMTKKSMNHE